jgi:hypothetical protein
LMASCAAFHRRTFLNECVGDAKLFCFMFCLRCGGAVRSNLTWSVHGPVSLEHDTAYYRTLVGGCEYWNAMNTQLVQLVNSGGLPPAVRSSEESCSVPSMVTVVAFADWGREDVGEGTMGRYFISKNNRTVGSDLSDIRACGGSCAGYLGQFLAVNSAAAPRCGVASVFPPGIHRYGLGFGFLSEEGWHHPEVRP